MPDATYPIRVFVGPTASHSATASLPPVVAVHRDGTILAGFTSGGQDEAGAATAGDGEVQFGGSVVIAVDGTGSMHSNMPFVRDMLVQMVPQMWATGRRVVLVNWAARKIANWDVPYAEYNSPEEARVAVRAWLDEVVNRVQIVEGHYEDVTRLRVGGRTDIWGSLFQVFGLTREIRATHGEGHNVSVMMLTDGVHNGLATPSWWTGPPPADCAFPLGTFVFRDGFWTKSADNTCTLDKGLARAVPPSTPVTFVGIKDAQTAEIERINHAVEGRLVMVSNLDQLSEAFDADFGGQAQAGLEHTSGMTFPFVREEDEDGVCRAVGGTVPMGVPATGVLSLSFGASIAPVELTEYDPAGVPLPPSLSLVMQQLAGCEITVAALVATQPPFSVDRIHAATVAAERKVQAVLRSLPRMRKAAFDDLESTLDSVRTATGEVDSRRRAQQLLREHGYVRAIDTTETQGGAAADVPASVEEGMPADDAVLEAVVRGVPGFTDENAESVLAVMRNIGVTSVADLEFVSQSDMADCKVTVIQTRKLLAAFAKLIAATTVAISDVPSALPAAEAHTCKIPLDSVATITAFMTAVFNSSEIWSCDLLARCRGLLKALSMSLEGAHTLEQSTDLTNDETERLLGNLQAMAMPTRRARKLVQFLDNLKGATTPIVAALLRKHGDFAAVAVIDAKKGRGYKVELVSKRYDGGGSRFVWLDDALHYTIAVNTDEDNCAVCLEPEIVANFDFRCQQCRTFLHSECRDMLFQQFGNTCVVCRSAQWVAGAITDTGPIRREPIFSRGYPAVAVAMGYSPDTLVHEPGLFSVLRTARDAEGTPVVVDMGDVWASMRGAGTVPGEQLSSSTIEIALAATLSAEQYADAAGGGGAGAAPPAGLAEAGAAPPPRDVLATRHQGVAVVNAVLPLAFDEALYHAFKWRGLLYASAINSTGSLWALIPVHRMFPQAAVQFYFHGNLELALQMIAAYKHCYDDPEYPDPRFGKAPIGQLSPTEPIGNGKNHSPGLMAVEALCRWIVRGGSTGVRRHDGARATGADAAGAAVDNHQPDGLVREASRGDAAGEADTVHVDCGMCHEPFPVSPIFKGQSLRCARCRATGIEWKQSWLTTVWFRSLGLSLGNKPHSKSPPAMKMAVRCALWGLQEEMQKSLHLPDFKIRAFVAALDDEQKLAAAPLLEAFLYELYAVVLQPLDTVVHLGWARTVQLAQWAVALHQSIDDVMATFETSCHAKVTVDYTGFHLPAIDWSGELCELRDLPPSVRGPLVVGMFSVFLNHDVPPRKPGGAATVATFDPDLRDVDMGPRIQFQQAYDPDESADNPVIVVLGAGDHGKSTLLGSTFASQMTPEVVKKYTEMMKTRGQGNLAFAWLSDLSKHERYRGCTSKPHYWNFHTGSRQCALIDVPGQAKYLKSAYIGMAAADAAILVISALPAEFEPALRRGGQAWNHCIATKSMVGISRFIVAITKMDLVGFKQEAFDAACEKVCNLQSVSLGSITLLICHCFTTAIAYQLSSSVHWRYRFVTSCRNLGSRRCALCHCRGSRARTFSHHQQQCHGPLVAQPVWRRMGHGVPLHCSRQSTSSRSHVLSSFPVRSVSWWTNLLKSRASGMLCAEWSRREAPRSETTSCGVETGGRTVVPPSSPSRIFTSRRQAAKRATWLGSRFATQPTAIATSTPPRETCSVQRSPRQPTATSSTSRSP
eukprot:m.351753 g.351753  ORF g.351753 m.351753 type:complete len:1696 (-) comp27982_c1_seq1:652-5739(-)